MNVVITKCCMTTQDGIRDKLRYNKLNQVKKYEKTIVDYKSDRKGRNTADT